MRNATPEELEAAAREARRMSAAKRLAAVPMVTIRVNEWGAGVIATGEHDPDTFDNLYHEEGELVRVPLESAKEHVANRIASIVPDADGVVTEEPEAVIRRGPGRPPKVN